MARLLSTYTNKIDRKGRVSVPARLRAALAAEQARCSDPGFAGLILFPSLRAEKVWNGCSGLFIENLVGDIDALDPFGEEADDFSVILAEARELPWDGEGRIVLPPDVIEDAGIDGQVMFAGRGAYIEIGAPEVIGERIALQSRRVRQDPGRLSRARRKDGA